MTQALAQVQTPAPAQAKAPTSSKPLPPLLQAPDPAAVIEEMARGLRAAKKARSRAIAHKAEILKQLSLAEIAEREARHVHDLLEDKIHTALGLPAPERETIGSWKTLSWDDVWCPRCKHTFVPSRAGLKG